MNKFWTIESGETLIDEQSLYDFLFSKGVRCSKKRKDGHKWIVTLMDNTLTVYTAEDKLWRFCYCLLEQEFTSVTEEEMNQVKKALKKIKGTLKKRNLTQVKKEDLRNVKKVKQKNFYEI